MKPLNKYIDHTLLKPASTRSQLEKLSSSLFPRKPAPRRSE